MKLRDPHLARIAAALRGEPGVWPEGTDWTAVARVAERHGVLVLLARATRHATLAAAARPLTERALTFTHQLRGLVDLFTSHNLSMLPVKGPVLAATAYGDVALRGASGDLDLVVRASDFDAALELMIANGYSRVEGAIDEHDHEQWETEAHLFPNGPGTLVELHTELIGNFYTVPVDLDAVLARAGSQRLFGTTVPVLAAEDLLLYLCLHGARHMWSRLLWVCDIDALVRSTPELDWDELFARADGIDARQRVLLALYLAHHLLGTTLPERQQRRLRGVVLPVVGRVVSRRMSEAAAGQAAPGLVMRFITEVSARETAHQHATYLRRQLAPNARDRAWIRLPRGLRWLHWIVRPVRVLTRYGAGIRKP